MQYQSSELNQSIRLMQKLRNNTSIPYTMIKQQDSKAKFKKILDHLKQTIIITDDELEFYRDNVNNMDFDPFNPIDLVFSKVDTFIISQAQTISLAMFIIKN